MKDLTTFIYGLILLFVGLIQLYICKENFGFNLHLINGFVGLMFLWIAISKLEKSTN